MIKNNIIILISLLLLFVSCNNGNNQDRVPNLFKHGMHGVVHEVSTQTYLVEGDSMELYPDGYILLWNEPANMTKVYDIQGNIVCHTHYNTFQDKNETYYYYQDGLLHYCVESTTDKNGMLLYSDEVLFDYDNAGHICQYKNKIIKTYEDGQICGSEEHISIRGVEPFTRTIMYDEQGNMVMSEDVSTNASVKKIFFISSYNNEGLLISQQTNDGCGDQKDITYLEFDSVSNWTKRKIIETNSKNQERTYIQHRTITYHK